MRLQVLVGDTLVERLSVLTDGTLRVLAAARGSILGFDHEQALERLGPKERAALRTLSALLGENAIFEDLIRVTAQQWGLLAASWGASGSDWNNARRALSVVLTSLLHGRRHHAVREHIINAMPVLPEKQRVPDVSPSTFWRIMAQVPPEAKQFPVVLVVTGLRHGEYERLDPVHLRHETHTIGVPGSKTDGSSNPFAAAEKWWPTVVAAVPLPFRYSWSRRIWEQACEAAGVFGVTLHDLRHCHGQFAVNEGASLQQVQAQLRHTDIAMTQRYVKQQEARQSADAVGRALDQATRPQ